MMALLEKILKILTGFYESLKQEKTTAEETSKMVIEQRERKAEILMRKKKEIIKHDEDNFFND